ncbi:MAG TPA: TetR family transcriptional regulator [Segetibacter sp.]|nr:TetR family transcriptional regulator [Segetibacter sp.]
MEFNEKQKQILSAAEHLFSIKGFDGTSVRDIADDAGVNIAMISYYFGSKEKLMEALFEQRTTNIKVKVESLLRDDKSTPFEKVELLAEDIITRIMNKQQFFKIMMCEQVINKNPVIMDLIYDLKKKNLEEFSKLIRDGQQSGAFKKNIDVLLLMNIVVGTVSQMMTTIDVYRELNELKNMPEEKVYEQMKKKLSQSIKVLFKALLGDDA